MKYHYKLVSYKKIIQKWVSIYETNECDIGIPDIHRSFHRLTVVNGTPGIGALQIVYVGHIYPLISNSLVSIDFVFFFFLLCLIGELLLLVCSSTELVTRSKV